MIDTWRLQILSDLVMMQLKHGDQPSGGATEKEQIQQELQDLLPKVKDMALNARKGQAQASEDWQPTHPITRQLYIYVICIYNISDKGVWIQY